MPSTNVEFWENKIRRNRENDVKNITSLTSSGWKVITVWECAIRGKSEDEVAKMIEALVVKITNPFSEHVSCIPYLAG
jgi:DNA mismatch endonuclease (patch repair protein)